MVRVLDLLETYLRHKGYIFERLDGGVRRSVKNLVKLIALEMKDSLQLIDFANLDRIDLFFCCALEQAVLESI
jgi:hypothetical protein